jgi:hypothetical protein
MPPAAAIQARLFLYFGSLCKSIKIKIHGTVVLPVLCGCEALFLTLREETVD